MTAHACMNVDAGVRRITTWRMLQTAAGRYRTPAEAPDDSGWIDARAPGTAASALEAAGLFDRASPVELDAYDHWFRAEIEVTGARRLLFHGLAGVAEIYIDGALAATSESMFVPCSVDVVAHGRVTVDVAFRALAPRLSARGPRARWRPRAVTPNSIRSLRQTLIGRMPGWCAPIHAVGLWRPVELIDVAQPAFVATRVATRLERDVGVLEITASAGPAARISCAGASVDIAASEAERRVTLRAPGVAAWFPHTHGEPVLHDVVARVNGREMRLGRVGFRAITLDRGADGRDFALTVNGVPVFCRGANWISADVVSLAPSRSRIGDQIALAREAGMNMLRCPGSTVYEADAFYETCDELGVLVWQDFMFANLDYPDDGAFQALVAAEARAFLARTQWSPSLAVFCGGAEIAQQAAMLGLPEASWRHSVFDTLLPAIVGEARPDAIYTPHSPDGGDLPFATDHGLCHYYGVSAHRRGFDDIRRAQVRFATECLGFSHAPRHDPELTAGAAIRQPVHGERIAGDTGAVWHFESVRNHYTQALYGVDCEALRAADPRRYLALARATTCEVARELFAEWRSHGSPTRGALALFFQDVEAPGAGWGVVDHLGAPKPVWHALRQAFAPVSLTMTDEGLNGYRVTLVNETTQARDLLLVFECLRAGGVAVAAASRRVRLVARSVDVMTSAGLLGGFFDVAYAYKFGEPSHDVVVARLVDPETHETVAQASAFPLGRGAERIRTGLAARLERDAVGWSVVVTTQRFAQNVQLRFAAHRAADDWFHLAPREVRRIALRALGPGEPAGMVTSLNDVDSYEVTT